MLGLITLAVPEDHLDPVGNGSEEFSSVGIWHTHDSHDSSVANAETGPPLYGLRDFYTMWKYVDREYLDCSEGNGQLVCR
ncbi:hypothetical protein GCM10009563_16820 [Subtercola frigoramans]